MSENRFLIQELNELMEVAVGMVPPSPHPHFQTPIERYFFIAFCWTLKAFELDGSTEVVTGKNEALGRKLRIYPQWDFNGWRVDYMMSFTPKSGVERRLVVECDGHDFHERTKEQAERDRSRDRELQNQGFTIFRFTGRELYRNPVVCASEAVGWLFNRK